MLNGVLVSPALEEILAFCAEDPVERVFLEDVARRGLGRFAALEEAGRLTRTSSADGRGRPAEIWQPRAA